MFTGTRSLIKENPGTIRYVVFNNVILDAGQCVVLRIFIKLYFCPKAYSYNAGYGLSAITINATPLLYGSDRHL